MVYNRNQKLRIETKAVAKAVHDSVLSFQSESTLKGKVVDKTDIRITELLKGNARMSYQELGDHKTLIINSSACTSS